MNQHLLKASTVKLEHLPQAIINYQQSGECMNKEDCTHFSKNIVLRALIKLQKRIIHIIEAFNLERILPYSFISTIY